MKRLLLALSFVLAGTAASANTLPSALPAYASPNDKAPVLGTAAAGSRIVVTPAPSGWLAVELAGPHTVYVTEKDTLKNFEVRPGASYLAAPRPDAPVIGLAGEDDPATFANVAGRYNTFSLNKPIVAYVRAPATPAAPIAPVAPVASVAPAPVAPVSGSFAVDAPVAPASTPVVASQPALMGDLNATLRNDIPASSPVSAGRGLELGEPRLARTFFGTLASTRSPLRPRRPHDFQLNDSAGQRVAFIDISRLMQIEQIDAFVGRPVTIFGTVEIVGPSKDVVIQAETLKLQ